MTIALAPGALGWSKSANSASMRAVVAESSAWADLAEIVMVRNSTMSVALFTCVGFVSANRSLVNQKLLAARCKILQAGFPLCVNGFQRFVSPHRVRCHDIQQQAVHLGRFEFARVKTPER